MQTQFSPEQLRDPGTREAEKILRACVHCGFCNATCPTFVLTGDELDSPRGRIYMMKAMLEANVPASRKVLTHIDRCLSCLACMTTCPSGVHYMHLVDQARHHIEQTGSRPLADRLFRRLLAFVLARPRLFRVALLLGRLAQPLAPVMPNRIAVLLRQARVKPAAPTSLYRPHVFPASGTRRRRVALLPGCVQQVLAPEIDAATVRLLTRHGCEVVVAKGSGCCGALKHHMGEDARTLITANIDAWTREVEGEGLDAIVINASGCGTMVKDYGFLLREDAAYAAKAARVSALAKDVSELASDLGLPAGAGPHLRVAYQSACSLQHGQRIHALPKTLLAAAGFQVLEIPEAHLCCGSAGTYNLLQPAMADGLRTRKAANIQSVKADVVAAGNIGCITQLQDAVPIPVVHTVQLLDWATGGAKPPQIVTSAGA